MRLFLLLSMLLAGAPGCRSDAAAGARRSAEVGGESNPSGTGGELAEDAEMRADGKSEAGAEPAAPDAATADGGAGGGLATTGCLDDPSLAPTGAVCIETVTGRLVDEQGDPVAADLLVSACGPRQCNPGKTDVDGRFSIPVNLHLSPSDYSVLGHARPEYAGFYYRLSAGSPGPQIEVGDLRLVRMRAEGDLIDVRREGAPAQDVTSGEVTLHIPAAVFVRVDVESNLLGEQGRRFKAQRIPQTLQDRYVDPVLGVVAVYALEPFEAQFELATEDRRSVTVRFSFQNTQGLPAESEVEVVALGSYLFPDWVTPAAFEPVATGRVSADAERIELDPGQGVAYLTWIGMRPAAK